MEQQEPTTRDIVNQFLSEMLDGVKQAGAFVSEQLPLVLQEYITWGIVSSAVYLVIPTTFFIFSKRVWKWAIKEADDSQGFSVAVAVVPSVIAVIMFIYNLLDIAKAIFAPRVYLIDELSKLL